MRDLKVIPILDLIHYGTPTWMPDGIADELPAPGDTFGIRVSKDGFDPVYGARPLKRAIQSELENPLAKAILEGRFAPKDTIRADYRGSKMVFEKAPAKAAA